MVEYYNLEKTAEMLKMTPGEINRIREQGKLRAFRDGVDWKFKKEEVENFLVATIKGRNAQEEGSPFGLDFDEDLLTSDSENMTPILADSASFDALVDQSLASDGIMPQNPSVSHDEELTLTADGDFSIENDILLNDSVLKGSILNDSILLVPETELPAENTPGDDFAVNLSADNDLFVSEDVFSLQEDVSVAENQPAEPEIFALQDTDGITADNIAIDSIAIDSATDSGVTLSEENIAIDSIAGDSVTGDGDSGLSLGGGSGISLIKSESDYSGIDLAEDDIILGGSGGLGGSSDINLAGDSGVSLIDAAAESDFAISELLGGSDAILELAPDDDILALVDGDIDSDTATVLGTASDADFQLNMDTPAAEDTESSSQVIAIDDDLSEELGLFTSDAIDTPAPAAQTVAGISLTKPAPKDSDKVEALLFTDDTDDASQMIDIVSPGDGLGNIGSDFSEDSALSGFGDLSGGFDSGIDPSAFAPVGGDTASPFGHSAAEEPIAVLPTPASSAPTGNEPFFSGASVCGLLAVFFLLFLAGTMTFDLIRNMWSWQEPFMLNSTLMDALKGILG
ncbi:MAG: helix-turn-helix domain-containing protein [Planctomycetaceae bacterium]|jgi:hypothetical protein|nr:helix-turn-helix domain-containing protein [Planctomycetaceae bacterium]